MMKKKSKVVLSVAVISLIVGGFFYNSITFAQRSRETTFKEAVKITVLEWSSRGLYFSPYPQDCGLTFGGAFSPLTLPFAFSPKEGFLTVTDLWVTFTAQNTWPDFKTIQVNISLNDGPEISTNEYYPKSDWGLKVVSVHVTDSSVYETIVQGLNKLTLTSALEFHIFRVTVFIEYEYLA